MRTVVLSSPAKLNLFLAITGRRPDGFHDLVSVVSPLAWGDVLTVTLTGAGFSLECDHPDVPLHDSNLILKAARVFQATLGKPMGAHFKLEKRIPLGAGLGGGSSNAAAALRALNTFAQAPLAESELIELAAQVGSDCPLFLFSSAVIMRGRGERVEVAAPELSARLRGRRVLVFKPTFGISTPWSYQQLAAHAPDSYLPAAEVENRLQSWLVRPDATTEELLFNQLEGPAFAKFLALPTLLKQLQQRYELEPRMSGSGSACFALLPENVPGETVTEVTATIRAAWGASAFIVETRLT